MIILSFSLPEKEKFLIDLIIILIVHMYMN